MIVRKESLIDRDQNGEHHERRTPRGGKNVPSVGNDQQMGGQGETSERDSWGDGEDEAEMGKREGDAEKKHGP